MWAIHKVGESEEMTFVIFLNSLKQLRTIKRKKHGLEKDIDIILCVFVCVCYRDNVSCFDVEAGQVVVIAVVFQSPNLKGRWRIWQTERDS